MGGIVIKPRPFEFYTFAKYIHPAAELTIGNPLMGVAEQVKVLGLASMVCEILYTDEFCTRYLPATCKRAREIFNVINLLTTGTPKILSDESLRTIKTKIHAFETTLQDDLEKLPLFCCEDAKIGNPSVGKLLNGASNGYPANARLHLTPQCREEIDEAGKCLVFDRSTAAGFHTLRSLELTIRQYLLAIPGFVMPPLNRQNWGEYLKLLKDNGAGRDVTDHLHNIKDNYRNPLMHPEDTLEIDEAVSVFGLAQSMNEMLVADMKKRRLLKT